MIDTVSSAAQPIVGGQLIRVSGVGKVYGRRRVLGGVDLTLCAGEVLGLVGPNGAGKSTLLRILSAMAMPTDGEGEVLGRSIHARSGTAPFLGMMIERPVFIETLSAHRNLTLLFGIRRVADHASVEAVLVRVGLDPHDRRPVSTFSLGMRQRLSLAQAIGERPSLLILDEPTNGLDPSGIAEMRGLIRSLAEEGMAVLLASHLLAEVEAVCDRVMMLKEGRVVRTIEATGQSAAHTAVVHVEHDDDMRALAEVEGVAVIEVLGPRTVRLAVPMGVPGAVRLMIAAGVGIEAIYRDRGSLERVYLEEVAR